MNNKFMVSLRNRLQKKSDGKHGRKEVMFSIFDSEKILRLDACTIEDILPHLLVHSSMASIDGREKMWVATSMLARFLDTFTNALVVLEKGSPVGMLGGREVLVGLSRDPSNSFFLDSSVRQAMDGNLYTAFTYTRVSDLLGKMMRSHRDFALIKSEYGEYSSFSARRLLEVGILCDTEMRVSDIPAKPIPTFGKDDTIGEIISEMIQTNTEVMILENTPLFVNTQIIFQKIVELNYLENVNNFFDLKASVLQLKSGKIISENTAIPDMCRTMLEMRHAFVITHDKVVTSLDLLKVFRG